MNQVLQDQSHDCTLNNLIHIKCTLSSYCTLLSRYCTLLLQVSDIQ